MSNHDNHRRGEKKRTEHGPTWEGPNPGKGCNSTHVARARAAWKRLDIRAERRAGRRPFFRNRGVLAAKDDIDEQLTEGRDE